VGQSLDDVDTDSGSFLVAVHWVAALYAEYGDGAEMVGGRIAWLAGQAFVPKYGV